MKESIGSILSEEEVKKMIHQVIGYDRNNS